jgi:hypothetical protein
MTAGKSSAGRWWRGNGMVERFVVALMHAGLVFDRPTAGLVVSALRGGPLSTAC